MMAEFCHRAIDEAILAKCSLSARATPYAKSKLPETYKDGEFPFYWLRSPGSTSDSLATSGDGLADRFGIDFNETIGVRPILWVSKEALEKKEAARLEKKREYEEATAKQKPAEIYANKIAYLVAFITAIVVLAHNIAQSISGLASEIKYLISGYYVNANGMAWDIVRTIVYGAFVVLLVILMLKKPKNRGRTLLIASGVYLMGFGLLGFWSEFVQTFVIGIFTPLEWGYFSFNLYDAMDFFGLFGYGAALGLGIAGLILVDRKPKTSIILASIPFVLHEIEITRMMIDYAPYGIHWFPFALLPSLILDMVMTVVLALSIASLFEDQEKTSSAPTSHN